MSCIVRNYMSNSEKINVTLTLAELSELLQWADNMYTKSVMSEFGGQIADKLWESYKQAKAQQN